MTSSLFILLQILILTDVSLSQTDGSTLSVLRRQLFSNYDKSVIPREDEAPLTVYVGLAPRWMDLDSNGVLTAILWLKLLWTDYRLTWNPEENGNITVFRSSPRDVWKPDVSLYNKHDLNHGILAADPRSASTDIHIYDNGKILWIVPVSHKVLCEGVTYSNWPWGRQHCNLKFGSWTHDQQSYDLEFYNDQGMDLTQFGEYNQFKILRQTATREVKKYECCPYPYVNLNFLFSLKRKYVVDPQLGRIDNPSAWE